MFRVKCKSIQDADKASKCSQKSDWFKKTTVTKHEELKKGL